MSHLKDYLDYYKTLESPGYAVLVTGAWGAGKTFQVKMHIPEEERIYVSLFGIQTVDQLHSEVFAAAAPSQARAEKIVNRATEIVANMKGPWALAAAVPGMFSSLMRKEIERDRTIIFDDLERSDLQLKDILGAINTYVEHLGFRVIVIAHDKKIADDFTKMKEKMFGQSIRVEPDIEAALTSFISTISNEKKRKFASDYRMVVADVFARSRADSLRILRHVVEDLVRLYDALDDRHLANTHAVQSMVKLFVALQVEVRSGNLNAKDIHGRKGARFSYALRSKANKDTSEEKPKFLEISEKYPAVDLEDNILNDDVLSSILVNGQFPIEQIKASIDSSTYFMVPEKAEPWKVIMQFDDLDDDEVNAAVDRMNEQFRSRSILNSGEMLHVFCLRMLMADIGVIQKTTEQVLEENKAYIRDLLELGKLPPRELDWRWHRNFERSHGGFTYWIPETHEKYFRETLECLVHAREEAFRRTAPEIGREILRMVRENSRALFESISQTNNGPNPFAFIPIMHRILPSDFADAWFSSPVGNWRDVYYAIENRYSSGQLSGDLVEEKTWAIELRKEILARAGKETGFRAFRIRRMVPKVLLSLE